MGDQARRTTKRGTALGVAALTGAMLGGCTSHRRDPPTTEEAATTDVAEPSRVDTAYAWLEALRRHDEITLRRYSATPSRDTTLFHVAGFQGRDGPCRDSSRSAAEFTEQLGCLMRDDSRDELPELWSLRELDPPTRAAEAWSVSPALDDIGLPPPFEPALAHDEVAVAWTHRVAHEGGCRYAVAVDASSRINRVARQCWLE